MKLKIFKQNPWLENKHPEEIMATPIEVLNGITKGEPKFVKGTKVNTEYYSNEKENVVVRQSYADMLDGNGFLVGITMKIEWFDEMGNPALFKNVKNSLPISSASEEIRNRRKRQINYLQEAGVRLGISKNIDLIFAYYSAYLVGDKTLNLLSNYIENNTQEFKKALLTEKNRTIKAILKTKLPNGKVVKDVILEQIN